MECCLPIEVLDTSIYWLNNSWSFTAWNTAFSNFYKLDFGIRQRLVLSPILFAIYVNDIVNYRRNGIHNFVVLYADILLLAQPASKLRIYFKCVNKNCVCWKCIVTLGNRVECELVLIVMTNVIIF
jgi:hypothetical protein